jgi:hypothetical protein
MLAPKRWLTRETSRSPEESSRMFVATRWNPRGGAVGLGLCGERTAGCLGVGDRPGAGQQRRPHALLGERTQLASVQDGPLKQVPPTSWFESWST